MTTHVQIVHLPSGAVVVGALVVLAVAAAGRDDGLEVASLTQVLRVVSLDIAQ